MSLEPVTLPTAQPITLAEAKLHLRVDHAEDDNRIQRAIAAAAKMAEKELCRALMPQTWERRLDAFPAAEILLGRPPVTSIVSVTYIDPAGATQTVAPANYTLDASEGGWVLPAAGFTWPATAAGANVVRARFSCGYAAAADVPEPILQWMLLQIGSMYRSAEAFSAGVAMHELPNRFVDSLLDGYRYYEGWWG